MMWVQGVSTVHAVATPSAGAVCGTFWPDMSTLPRNGRKPCPLCVHRLGVLPEPPVRRASSSGWQPAP